MNNKHGGRLRNKMLLVHPSLNLGAEARETARESLAENTLLLELVPGNTVVVVRTNFYSENKQAKAYIPEGMWQRYSIMEILPQRIPKLDKNLYTELVSDL